MTTKIVTAWLWADKAIVRKIRDRVPDQSSALVVYYALCELASDNQAEAFQATQEAVASRSGLGVRTVRDRLKDLVAVGAIKMEIPPVRTAAHFELLNAIGNGCRSIGNKRPTIGNGLETPLPVTIEEESRINPVPETGESGGVLALESEPVKPKRSKTPKPRARDPLLDALVEACKGNPLQMTDSEMRRAAVALADIRSGSPTVTVAEIWAKADSYRRNHPTWTLTPNALSGHWSSMAGVTVEEGEIDPDLRRAF